MDKDNKNGIYYINVIIKFLLVVAITICAVLLVFYFLDKKDRPEENKLYITTNNLVFLVNESIDFDDAVVKMYVDNEEKILSSDEYTYDLSTVDTATPKKYYVKFTLNENKDIYGFVEIEIIKSRLQITNYNTNLVMGQEYNAGNYQAYILNKDNTRTLVKSNEIIIDLSNVQQDTVGTYDIIFKYPVENLTATYQINVINPPDAVVGIEIVNPQIYFEVGQEFFVGNSAIVYKVMGDNTKNAISSDEYEIDYSNYNKDEIGEYTIYVKYKNSDIMCSYKVEVVSMQA